MDITTSDVTVETEAQLTAELTASRPEHTALARLHDELVGAAPAEEITSYDRLHHRHNRS